MAFRYPKTMSTSNENTHISFISRKAPDGTTPNFECDLYAPIAFTMSDGAGYGNFDLGVIGGSGMVQQFMEGEKVDTAALQSKVAGDATDAQKKFLTLSAGSAVGAGGGVVDKVKDIYGVQKGIAINPNSVLQFTGNEIRGYTFEFRMIAQSIDESNQIRDIINGFRKYMYPEKEGFLLQYPDVWTIKFGNSQGELDYYPSIADCFLTNMSTTYNTTGNINHKNGSPADVTLQLQFREGRALSRKDILSLQAGNRVKISVE